jgi:hypothetical protein
LDGLGVGRSEGQLTSGGKKDLSCAEGSYHLSVDEGSSDGQCGSGQFLENENGNGTDFVRVAEYDRLSARRHNVPLGCCDSIAIPSCIRVLDKYVTSESGSQLERINESAFSVSGLNDSIFCCCFGPKESP